MLVLIQGGGDLASGVAYRLFKSGLRVVITELPQPLAIRRTVSFAEAVYSENITVEGLTASLVKTFYDVNRISELFEQRKIPIIIDPELKSISILRPAVIVDARMLKMEVHRTVADSQMIIGLGPGFTAGVNCHAVVETKRGHTLGKVYWRGSGSVDTGIPEGVLGLAEKRVLRSPGKGKFYALASICDHIGKTQPIGRVNDEIIRSPLDGILRGLLKEGLDVVPGMKIGDIDPRNDSQYCRLISDKALAIGGGVLEAILTREDFRSKLWD